MRTIMFSALCAASFFCSAGTAQAQVEPDPRRAPRIPVCTQFEANKPKICNFNPDVIGTRKDCLLVPVNGHMEYRCAEETPGYYERQRELGVALSCGERSFKCSYGYFEYQHCLYEIIPDSWMPNHQYQVRLQNLDQYQGVILYKPGSGRSYSRAERRFTAQMRFYKWNASGRNPNGYTNPCMN